jgi:outer membrane murein-binding lipoprotein Lpp
MIMKSLRLAVAIGSLGVISGCASDAEFQRFKQASTASRSFNVDTTR